MAASLCCRHIEAGACQRREDLGLYDDQATHDSGGAELDVDCFSSLNSLLCIYVHEQALVDELAGDQDALGVVNKGQ